MNHDVTSKIDKDLLQWLEYIKQINECWMKQIDKVNVNNISILLAIQVLYTIHNNKK